MQIVEAEENSVTVKFSSQEFTDLISAVSSVRDEYTILDEVMLDVPLERIERLDESLSDALMEAQRIR